MTDKNTAALAAHHPENHLDMVGRWYMVNRDGMATLCADREDAEKEAADAQSVWPHMGPHRAVRLVEASFEAADMAAAAAQGFRDGVASVAASAGSEPVKPEDYVPLLDEEGRMMVGTSHHYTAENIRALVQQLRRFADPQQSTQADWDALDWRGWCNVLGRIVAALADEVPVTHPSPPEGMAGWTKLRGQRAVLCSLLGECLPVIDALMQMPGDDDSDARLNGLAGRITGALNALAEDQVKGGES